MVFMRATYPFAKVNRKAATEANKASDAAAKQRFEQQGNDDCRQNLAQPVPDPNYTVRAWRAVVTYLLRRQEFLYE